MQLVGWIKNTRRKAPGNAAIIYVTFAATTISQATNPIVSPHKRGSSHTLCFISSLKNICDMGFKEIPNHMAGFLAKWPAMSEVEREQERMTIRSMIIKYARVMNKEESFIYTPIGQDENSIDNNDI